MEHKVRVDGAILSAETTGENGPAIVLVNGHMRGKSDFKLLAKRLAEEGMRVVVFDNRGCGQTQTSRPFLFADMVNDVAAVMEHVSVEQATVMGISMGGMIAQKFALNFPDKIARLILVSTTPDYQVLKSDPRPWGTDVEAITERLRHYVSPQFYSRNNLLIKSMAKQIALAVLHQNFDHNARVQRDAIAGEVAADRLSELGCKTLIIHGEMDEIINPKAAKTMHELIAQSTLLLFQGHGHLLLAEDSPGLTKAIINFCNSN